MNLDTIVAIAIIGGIIALAVLGLALRAMRQERQAQAARALETDASEAARHPAATAVAAEAPRVSAAPARPPGPEPLPSAQPPKPTSADAVEVVRVLRDSAGGALLVEMEGRRYRTVNEIKDQKHGLALVDVVMELQQFLGLDLVASLAAAEPADQEGRPAPEPPTQKPSMNPIKQMMILRDRELRKARQMREGPPQPSSIVEEIEAILVKRLVGSPFEGRSIHMRPGLHGGAHIDVDGHGYASIEDVADLDVKDFLKSVIAEWEAGK